MQLCIEEGIFDRHFQLHRRKQPKKNEHLPMTGGPAETSKKDRGGSVSPAFAVNIVRATTAAFILWLAKSLIGEEC